MVSPERKRQAVLHLQECCCASERRTCRVLNQRRATHRDRGSRRNKDAPLVAALRRVSALRPPAGYRMAAAHLRRESWTLKNKRAQRPWRLEGIKVPRRHRKLWRMGGSENSAQRRTTRINDVWSYDFVFDQTEDGKQLKWLPICDKFRRESVALEVERRMESGDVIPILDATILERGTTRSSLRRPCTTGLRNAGSRPSTSSLAARGRTLTAKTSTAASETSSGTGKASAHYWKPKCSARSTERTIIIANYIHRWLT